MSHPKDALYNFFYDGKRHTIYHNPHLQKCCITGYSVMMPTILVILAPYTSEQAVASHTSDSDDHTLIFSPSQKSQTSTLAHHKIVEYPLNHGLYKGE